MFGENGKITSLISDIVSTKNHAAFVSLLIFRKKRSRDAGLNQQVNNLALNLFHDLDIPPDGVPKVSTHVVVETIHSFAVDLGGKPFVDAPEE